ncbi:hypothetical protein Poli38472_010657 [Pythium oligandrum]|uniref:Uncharacterized protein n=1 Tax=Pythium oligandrum TaxID=41045 RepID=A0A8K1C3J8_PYTOL|nr:hypothetical protein Poli38472_010657 [Pythium oligandrum]|eukprot:TMW55775.1 hypothetical protein Poli38472_010657 [Pythium oligandrum]
MVMPPQLRAKTASAMPMKDDAPKSSSVNKRSPIKKHLQHAAVAQWPTTSGEPFKADMAILRSNELLSPTRAALPVENARARASVLQAVLSLMDHEESVVKELVPMLDVLASIPLDNEHVRRECLMALQRIQGDPSASTQRLPSTPVKAKALSRGGPRILRRRDSGRAKSPVSLRHCKEFLLACANEIHELEETNPRFDYAETCSEAAAPASSSSVKKLKNRNMDMSRSLDAFDYMTNADTSVSSGSSVHGDEDTDDVDADQGTQLSEMLCRAVEAEEEEEELEASKKEAALRLQSLRERQMCRTAFQQLRVDAPNERNAQVFPHDLARMFQAFTALKRHRALSSRNLLRKRLVFGRMKTMVKKSTLSSAPVPETTTVAVAPTLFTSKVQRVLARNWEFVVFLVIALAVQLLQ